MFNNTIAKMKFRAHRRMGRWITAQSEETYQELSRIVFHTIQAVSSLFPEVMLPKEINGKVPSLSYQMGWYRETFTRIGWKVNPVHDKQEVVAQRISTMLTAADTWRRSLLDPREMKHNAEWIRDLSQEVLDLYNKES